MTDRVTDRVIDQLPDHVSLDGLSGHARLLMTTCVTLKSMGLYTCENMEKALVANGMNAEEINSARREVIMHVYKG